MNDDYREDETLTALHKLLDEGTEIRLFPAGDLYLINLIPMDTGRVFCGVGNDIGEALDDAIARQDRLREEGSA